MALVHYVQCVQFNYANAINMIPKDMNMVLTFHFKTWTNFIQYYFFGFISPISMMPAHKKEDVI